MASRSWSASHNAAVAAFVLLALACGYTTSDEDGLARVLIAKQIQNRYLVEGMDVVIKYTMYNVGDVAATNVIVTETGFSQDDFDVVGGQMAIKLDRLPAHSNNSHTLVVRPKKFGYFNFTSATVTYKASASADDADDSGDVQVGFSSDPGQALIISAKDYERQFSAHVIDWAMFAVMTLPSLGVPFMLWYSSKSKYEALTAKAK